MFKNLLALILLNAVCFVVAFAGDGSGIPQNRTRGDFDGDGKADIGIFRFGEWYILPSSGGPFIYARFGQGGDTAVPADYDGDGKTDIAVYRGQIGSTPPTFYVLKSSDGSFFAQQWGISGDLVHGMAGDYDGDGKSDIAVYRPAPDATSHSYFYILQSSDGQMRAIAWGTEIDSPRAGDFDGDGKADPTVMRSFTFYTLRSSDNKMQVAKWGVLGLDSPAIADFDGDRKADIGVFRHSSLGGANDAGTWYIRYSSGQWSGLKFGLNSADWTVAADYDGDGKDDIALYRHYEGTWYILQSRDGLKIVRWGAENDSPLTRN